MIERRRTRTQLGAPAPEAAGLADIVALAGGQTVESLPEASLEGIGTADVVERETAARGVARLSRAPRFVVISTTPWAARAP